MKKPRATEAGFLFLEALVVIVVLVAIGIVSYVVITHEAQKKTDNVKLVPAGPLPKLVTPPIVTK